MKKYLAIGHFKESKNITSVAMECTTKKSFYESLLGNEFVPYAIITPKKMKTLESKLNDPFFGLWDEVKKLNSNYRTWDVLRDYIEQCFDIMKEKIENA